MTDSAHLSDHAAVELDRRVKLAASPATGPDLLAGLATDSEVTVRAAAALNPSLPPAAQNQLATDADERVRLLLARKLAGALPGLSGPDQATLRDRTIAILSSMVRDEVVRIRAAIAASLASLPDISHDIALTLAHDAELSVSEPVLRLSPLLSAHDLLALLADPPHGQTAAAIACRADLPEAVADVIAATADSPAIRALLANESSAIREGTLDALIARAAGEPGWHAPLVRRPRLPNHAALALAEIVAGHLLDDLAGRADLDPAIVRDIRRRIKPQLAAAQTPGPGDVTDETFLGEASRMDARGELTEAKLLAALRAGEVRRAAAMLAVAAGVKLDLVDRAAALRSAKGLVSLVWKAGFTMRVAGPVQMAVGRIGPALLLAATRTGDFPLGPEEMGWQLDFLSGR